VRTSVIDGTSLDGNPDDIAAGLCCGRFYAPGDPVYTAPAKWRCSRLYPCPSCTAKRKQETAAFDQGERS
jgi:hypothetical protein